MSQQINLYEERLRPRHELATGRNLGIGVLALLVATTLAAVFTARNAERASSEASAVQKQLTDEQTKLSAVSKQLAERRVTPALAKELEIARGMLDVRSEVIAVLDSGRLGNSTGFSGFLNGFARQAQNDWWLTAFSISAGGEEIEIRGRLFDPSRLPSYVLRLSNEPVFRGRRFAALEMRGVDPAEDKEAPPAVLNVKDGGEPPPALARFIEFILRSENGGTADAAAGSGAKR